MLQGYRTYITLLAGIIIKILEQQGIVVTSQGIENAIDVLVLVAAGLFRYFATKNKTVVK